MLETHLNELARHLARHFLSCSQLNVVEICNFRLPINKVSSSHFQQEQSTKHDFLLVNEYKYSTYYKLCCFTHLS